MFADHASRRKNIGRHVNDESGHGSSPALPGARLPKGAAVSIDCRVRSRSVIVVLKNTDTRIYKKGARWAHGEPGTRLMVIRVDTAHGDPGQVSKEV